MSELELREELKLDLKIISLCVIMGTLYFMVMVTLLKSLVVGSIVLAAAIYWRLIWFSLDIWEIRK